MTGVLAAVALLAPCAASDSGSAEIRGRVRDATARAAVAHAVVEVRGGGATRRVRTDPRGAYRMRGLTPGWLTVAVTRQGYRRSRVRVRVSAGQCLKVDFAVKLDPVELSTLRVLGLPSGREVEAPAPGTGRWPGELAGPGAPELETLRSTPLGGTGLGRAVRRSVRPEPADPSVLFLRGATTPFKQILLDGAPVQTPFHMAGLLASHPAGVIGSTRLRSGGSPPRFGGGLLYTLDLRTRSPEQAFRTSGSLDLLGTSARASGRLAGGEFLASARTLHPGRRLGRGTALDGRRYSDGLLRLSAGGERGARGSATGFWNRASTPLDADDGSPVAASWANVAGSVRLATGDEASGWRATVAASRYRSELPLTDAVAEGMDAEVGEQRTVVRYEDRRGSTGWTAGAALRRKAQRLRLTGTGASALDVESGAAHRVGGFVSARWRLSERISLRAGLRTDYFSPDGSVRAAPRAAATLRISPGTTARLSVGRVQQLLAGWDTRRRAAPDGEGVRVSAGDAQPRVAGASRLELRLSHRSGDGLRLGAEGHFRRLRDVSPAALFDTVSTASSDVAALDPGGHGVYSSGLDLWGSWSGSDVRLWGSYSLTWLWGAPGPSGVSSRFAGRQVLSGGVGVTLPAGFRATGTLAGSWGLPMTPLPVTGPAAVESGDPPRDDGTAGSSPYVRVDARLERDFSVRLFGGGVELTPYVEVINALDRDDSQFHRLPAAGGGLQPVNPIPMLPVVGVEWGG